MRPEVNNFCNDLIDGSPAALDRVKSKLAGMGGLEAACFVIEAYCHVSTTIGPEDLIHFGNEMGINLVGE